MSFPPNVAQCPRCSCLMLTGVLYCPKCGEPRSDTRARLQQAADARGETYEQALEVERGPYPFELSDQRRSAILQAQIAMYMTQGYRVISQTPTTAQMKIPKEFSFFIAVLGLLLFFVGLLVYVIFYASQSEPMVSIAVDERGDVQARRG